MAELYCIVGGVNPKEVLQDTWGHLSPEPGKKYHGFILFSKSAWGEETLLEAKFEGLDANPWTFDHLNEFMYENADKVGDTGVFRWEGWYRVFKNENFQFQVADIELVLSLAG